jgi:hypothetical protein
MRVADVRHRLKQLAGQMQRGCQYPMMRKTIAPAADIEARSIPGHC